MAAGVLMQTFNLDKRGLLARIQAESESGYPIISVIGQGYARYVVGVNDSAADEYININGARALSLLKRVQAIDHIRKRTITGQLELTLD